MIVPLILSGGSGTRLWPLSTSDKPKQFLPLISDRTMIQETYLRLKGLDVDTPIISCNQGHRFLVAQQLGELCDAKPEIILEPVAKNTAPAIAAGCMAAMRRDKDAVVVVLPSDHVIRNIEVFQKSVMTAVDNALQGYLVTFGIVPTFPSTGYGYVKGGEHIAHHVYALDKFVEKPALEVAQQYLASGEYSWNSGMFVFKASVFLDEFKALNPEMYEYTKESFEKASIDDDFIRLDKECFDKIKGDSIDYAVMEKTSRGRIVKLNAGWDDVGSWSAIWSIQNKDEHGNAFRGDVVAIDTSDSYVYSSGRTIATIGLDNVVVVESDKAVLVAAKGKVQDVKKVADIIAKRN